VFSNELNSKQREEYIMKIMIFSAAWCGPCQVLKPIIGKLKEELTSVEFEVVDIDTQPELATEMGVRAVPTLMFLKDGEVKDTAVGLLRESEIRKKIEELA